MSTIQEILVACLPAVSSIISMVAIVVGIYKKFNNLIASVKDKTDQQELLESLEKNLDEDKIKIQELTERNSELANQIQELISKIDKIRKS